MEMLAVAFHGDGGSRPIINGERTMAIQQRSRRQRRCTVQATLPSRTKPRAAQAGRPIFDDIEVVELRYPGSQELAASIPATAFSHWGDRPRPASRSRSPTPSGSRGSTSSSRRSDAQTKSGTPLDLCAVPDRGQARRAAGAEHLHGRGARRDRRQGAEEPRPGRARAEEQGAWSTSRKAKPAPSTRRWWPSWRRCAPRNAVLEEDSRPAQGRRSDRGLQATSSTT